MLGAADVLRWIAWMLRAAGPFLIGNDVIPAPPSYPPSPNAETVVLLTFCTACMVLSIRLAAAIAGRAGPRRFRGRSTDRVG